MKKASIIINLLLFVLTLNAQSNNSIISLSYGFGNMNYSSFSSVACDCSYQGDKYTSISLNTDYKISNKLWIRSGLSYQKTSIKATFFPSGVDIYKYYNIELISIPLTFKYDFREYFATELGISYRFDINNNLDNKKGIGLFVALIFQYPISEKLSVFMKPFLQYHDLFHVGSDHFNFHIKGINTGVTYLF